MIKDTKKAADFIIGCAMMLVSIIFYAAASKMPDSVRGIGPGDYPKFVCVLLFILGLVQTLRIVLTAKGVPLVDVKSINRVFLLRVLIQFIALALYYFFMRIIGFPIASILFCYGSMMLFGYKKKVKALIISVVFSLLIYYLFVNVFQVLLPGGFLG